MNTRKPSQATLLPSLIGLGALFVLFVALAVSVKNNASAPITPPPQITEQSTLPAPTLDLPPERQTVEAMLEQTRLAVTITPPTGTPYYNPPTVAPITPEPWDWGSGIISSGDAPFPAMSHSIYNRWYGMVNDQRMIVYAGGLRDDPGVSPTASQGLVIVIAFSPPAIEFHPEFYNTPSKLGPVRVAEEVGLRLVLMTPDGDTFYFDVPSRQFVDSLTATPPPTITALPSPTSISYPTAYPVATLAP